MKIEGEAWAANPRWGTPILFEDEPTRCPGVTTIQVPYEQFIDVQCVLREGHSETVTGPHGKPTRKEATPHVFAFEQAQE